MKKITSILLLVAVFATMFTMTAFAAENTNVFTVTADKTSAVAGDAVYVNVQLDGDFTDVAMVQYSIKYDAEKFSTVTTGRAPWGFDKTWYDSTKDGNTANLGYINTPSFGENPAGTVNVLFLSTDGYYIDDAGDLYGDGKTTVAGLIKFTAKADVEVIDATCFEILNAKVSDTNGVAHTVTVNQIEASAPEFTPETVKGAVVEGEDDIVLEKDPATAYDNTYLGTAVFEATLGADVKYGEAGFIWVKDDVESANKFTVDASVIAGGGTFEYAVAMYAIPDGVDIDAIPYYVTAE